MGKFLPKLSSDLPGDFSDKKAKPKKALVSPAQEKDTQDQPGGVKR